MVDSHLRSRGDEGGLGGKWVVSGGGERVAVEGSGCVLWRAMEWLKEVVAGDQGSQVVALKLTKAADGLR